MFRFLFAWLLLFLIVSFVSASDTARDTVVEWNFTDEENARPWHMRQHLEGITLEKGTFRATVTGHDPFIGITGLNIPVAPFQYVELVLRTNNPGRGELFYSNNPQSGHEGFSQSRTVDWQAETGDHERVYRLYPDWISERVIRKLRLDFPPLPGEQTAKPFVELRSIRIVSPAVQSSETVVPDWNFQRLPQGWQFLKDNPLRMESDVFAFSLPTSPPWISWELASDQLQTARLEWITEEGKMGTFDFNIIPGEKSRWYNIDTSQLKKPIKGNNHLFRFSCESPDRQSTVQVKRLMISDAPQGPADVTVDHAWFSEPINRAGKTAPLSMKLTNIGGKTAKNLRISHLTLPAGGKNVSPEGWEHIPPIEPMQTIVHTLDIDCEEPQEHFVVFRFDGFGAPAGDYSVKLNILPDLGLSKADYVPEPKPVASDFELGAFYFPGWAKAEQWKRIIATHPERKPVLGWYDEANPEVIDWQIKWAVENGLRFFLVDWYWSRGNQHLDHWVKGFQKARYKSYLKWAMMWANHNGPGSHSEEDQAEVTQFWIDNYFGTPEYYTIDGKPVVMIWSPEGMDDDIINIEKEKGNTLKKGEGVKKLLDLSRKMAQDAGFDGIYFIAMKWPEASTDAQDIQWLADAGFDMTSIYHFMHHGGQAQNPMRFLFERVVEANKPHWEGLQKTGILPFLPNISTGWDSRPWHGNDNVIIENRTVPQFRTICEDFLEFSKQTGNQRAVLGPLNEWGEGSYAEPNLEYGFGMYETLREVFCKEPVAGWPLNYTPADVGLGPYDLPLEE